MSAMTDFLEDQLAEQVLNGIAPTPTFSGVVYVGLFSGAIDDTLTSGTAAEGEVTGGAYARVQVTSGFTVAAGTATNDDPVTYPTATAAWGTVSGVALFDDPTSGNALLQGLLTTARSPISGDVVRFASGELSVQFL